MRVLQPARLVCALEDGEIAPRAHVVHRRHALRGDVRHGRVERAILELRGRVRHDGVHEIRRVVLENAGRFAVARRGRSCRRPRPACARDPGRAQRRSVRERHVTVEPVDPDGIVRRDGVDPIAPRQLAAPLLVVPVAAGDPRARGHGRRECLDAATNSAGVFASRSCTDESPKPPSMKWTCESMKPGTTMRAAASMTLALPAILRTAALEPTVAIRSPRTANASAHGRALSPVQTRALTTASVTGSRGRSPLVIHRRVPASSVAARLTSAPADERD